MKKLTLILSFLLFSSLTVQTIYAGIITFDEPGLEAGYGPSPYFSGEPKGTPITDQFTNIGALFSIDANGVDYVSTPAVIGGQTGPSGGNLLAVNTVLPGTGTPATLTVSFIATNGSGLPTTVEALSFNLLIPRPPTNISPSVMIQAYGPDGSLLNGQGVSSPGADRFMTMSFTYGRIARIEFLDYGTDGFAIDDFRFGTQSQACPETIVFAQNPQTGNWGAFPSVCDIPPGWNGTTSTPPAWFSAQCTGSNTPDGNCATFNLFTNTLHVPCLNLGSIPTYWFDLSVNGLLNNKLNFNLSDFGEN